MKKKRRKYADKDFVCGFKSIRYSESIRSEEMQLRPPPTRVSQLAHMPPHQIFYEVEEREGKERECTISSSRAKLIKEKWAPRFNDMRGIMEPNILWAMCYETTQWRCSLFALLCEVDKYE
jgi:hypothetical protein